jgi:glycosyltransferase involved in cell wall biosynthesis
MYFSVIIPTYNRLPQLKLTLQSILEQKYTDYEIIVVDDGSTDGTDSFLKSLVMPKLKWVSQNNKGPAAARNAGIKLASGKFIAFTDDDCVVPPDWLSHFNEFFESSSVDIIGGAVHNSNKGNIFSETSQHVTNFFVEYLNQSGKSSSFLTSNNIAYRTDVLKKVVGFDERFKKAGGEERALNLKILNMGGKSLYAADIVVEHNHQMNFSKFVRQQINYGRGAFIHYEIVGRKYKSKPKKIPLLAYFELCKSFFKVNCKSGFLKFSLFGVSQFMTMLGFLAESFEKVAVTSKTEPSHSG